MAHELVAEEAEHVRRGLERGDRSGERLLIGLLAQLDDACAQFIVEEGRGQDLDARGRFIGVASGDQAALKHPPPGRSNRGTSCTSSGCIRRGAERLPQHDRFLTLRALKAPWGGRTLTPDMEVPMRRTLSMLSLLALMTATAAYATPALDAAGKCRDNGKFVSAKHCQAPATTGKCRDVKRRSSRSAALRTPSRCPKRSRLRPRRPAQTSELRRATRSVPRASARGTTRPTRSSPRS